MDQPPNKIFTYWHQGFDSAPPIIQACRTTFEKCNPDFELHFLDARSVREWLEPIPIPDDKWNRLSLAHRSDVIRTQLLVRYGGVWADPTVFFTRPLNDWLPGRWTRASSCSTAPAGIEPLPTGSSRRNREPAA